MIIECVCIYRNVRREQAFSTKQEAFGTIWRVWPNLKLNTELQQSSVRFERRKLLGCPMFYLDTAAKAHCLRAFKSASHLASEPPFVLRQAS